MSVTTYRPAWVVDEDDQQSTLYLYGVGLFIGSTGFAQVSVPGSAAGNFDLGFNVEYGRYDLARQGTRTAHEFLHPPLPTPHPFNQFVSGGTWGCRVDDDTAVGFFSSDVYTQALANGNPDDSLNPLWVMVMDQGGRGEVQHVIDMGPLLGVDPRSQAHSIINWVLGYGRRFYAICTWSAYPSGQYQTSVVQLELSASGTLTATGQATFPGYRLASALLLADGRIAFSGTHYAAGPSAAVYGYLTGLHMDIRLEQPFFMPVFLLAATDRGTVIAEQGFYDANFNLLPFRIEHTDQLFTTLDGHYYYTDGLIGGAEIIVNHITGPGTYDPVAILLAETGFYLSNTLWISPDLSSFLVYYAETGGSRKIAYFGPTSTPYPLRLAQRDDGLALSAAPTRLGASNGPTSRQLGATPRVGSTNTYS